MGHAYNTIDTEVSAVMKQSWCCPVEPLGTSGKSSDASSWHAVSVTWLLLEHHRQALGMIILMKYIHISPFCWSLIDIRE